MPRGVPASGRRQPRAVPTGFDPAETALAAGPEDFAIGQPASTEVEIETFDSPDLDVIGVQDELIVVADEPVPPTATKQVVKDELTAEQQEIKYLRDQLAKATGKKDIEPVVDELAKPGDSNNILIHFLEDGLSALGQIWYRGQELEFELDSRAYKDTFDKLGRTWLDLRHDEFAQVERFGKIMFRNGPWPGKTYADASYEPMKEVAGTGSVKPPSAEEIERAEKLRKKRSAPRLPQIA